jgi:tetratricopeptide (TPR) repeat protein
MSRIDEILGEASKLREAKDWQGLLQLLESRLAEARKSGADEDAARILLEISRVPEETVGYERRVFAARESADILQKLGRPKDAAGALRRMAEIQSDKADKLDGDDDPDAESVRDSALEDLARVALLYEQAGDQLQSALTRFEIGQIHQLGPQEHDVALEHYEAAEPVIRRLGKPGDIAQCLFYKGVALYELQGGDEDLIALLGEALNLYRETGDKDGQALAHQYLVDAAATFDPDEARRLAEAGLAFARETGDDSLAGEIEDSLSRMEE